MSEVTFTGRVAGGTAAPGVPVIVSREPLTAAALPQMMVVDDPRGRYRYPLLQFIVDWNLSSDPATLVADPPAYRGDDPFLLPAVAVVVHALADRARVPIPGWVLGHRAPRDVMLFGYRFDGAYARWVRQRSLDVCSFHRVWFHPRTLDKGTPDWWLPWD